jgi:hypothetical protein
MILKIGYDFVKSGLILKIGNDLKIGYDFENWV